MLFHAASIFETKSVIHFISLFAAKHILHDELFRKRLFSQILFREFWLVRMLRCFSLYPEQLNRLMMMNRTGKRNGTTEPCLLVMPVLYFALINGCNYRKVCEKTALTHFIIHTQVRYMCSAQKRSYASTLLLSTTTRDGVANKIDGLRGRFGPFFLLSFSSVKNKNKKYFSIF